MKARKLIRNVWPGPVTIIFELSSEDMFSQHEKLHAEVFENLYKNASLGVRCPDNRTASGVLQLSESPVVAPSANEANREPATNAEKALAELDGKVDMLLDAGPCHYGKSSTVVRVKSTGLEIIRQGVYSAERLQEAAKVRILFVCTGNTCRSPMAEGIFRHYLAKKLNCTVDESKQMGYKVLSAGVMERVGYPATSEAIEACAGKGIDISSHRSQTLSKSLIDNSDVIFGMTERHCSEVKNLSPDATEKCLLLAGQQNITDPIGQPQQAYDFCADIIEKAIKQRIEELEI
jgi:protein-tyrosine-phosphatase